MDYTDKSLEALISGYLDGELGPEDKGRVERLLEDDPAFREEFERMKRLIAATADMAVDEPPDEVWDAFLENVYNRLERRTGWVIVILGAVVLAALGVYAFIAEPWGSPWLKALIATPVVGIVILFISVLRQRLSVAKTDRYSKEVQR